MSTLYYGSPPASSSSSVLPGVLLTRVQLLAYECEPMWQANQYQGSIHRVRVRGIFNPEVNAYAFNPLPGAMAPAPNLAAMNVGLAGAPTRDVGIIPVLAAAGLPPGVIATAPGQARGVVAPVTHISVRDWMMQPQRQLIYAVGSVPVLVSPGLNSDGTAATCDMWNGPMPLACDVVAVSGTKTFIVDYSVETYLNEAGLYVNTPSCLIGHTYERHSAFDQDYYATIVTRGRARFRTDRLTFLGNVPDDFRSYLFHPRPRGFKRVTCDVTAVEDGSAIEYVLVDKELSLSIVPNGVTRIECFHEVDNSGRNLEGLGVAMSKGATGWFKVPEPGQVSADPIPGVAEAESAVLAGIREWNHLLDQIQGVINAGIDFIPRLKCDIVARVWGRRDVLRSVLQNTAVDLVLARLNMSINPLARFFAGTRLALSHDVAGSFVECRGHIETALSGASLQLGAWLSGVPDIRSHFPKDSDDTNVIGGGPILADLGPDGTGMDLPNGFLGADPRGSVPSRGTYVGSLAAAALMAPHATPPSPAVPASGLNATPP